jgi:hypothetical protein
MRRPLFRNHLKLRLRVRDTRKHRTHNKGGHITKMIQLSFGDPFHVPGDAGFVPGAALPVSLDLPIAYGYLHGPAGNPISGICPIPSLIWGKTLGLGYVRLV